MKQTEMTNINADTIMHVQINWLNLVLAIGIETFRIHSIVRIKSCIAAP